MNLQSRKHGLGDSPRERMINAARKLFGSKGFHATTTAELAAEAAVSVGQIYRHFAAKNDIVLAIVEENVRTRVEEMHKIFDAVERSDLAMFEAMRAIVQVSLQQVDEGLSFEILAEAFRNPSVAERLDTMTAFYQAGVRRLAGLARPDVSSDELDAYVDIMMACFIGLSHRSILSRSVDIERTSYNTACLMVRALGLDPT